MVINNRAMKWIKLDSYDEKQRCPSSLTDYAFDPLYF